MRSEKIKKYFPWISLVSTLEPKFLASGVEFILSKSCILLFGDSRLSQPYNVLLFRVRYRTQGGSDELTGQIIPWSVSRLSVHKRKTELYSCVFLLGTQNPKLFRSTDTIRSAQHNLTNCVRQIFFTKQNTNCVRSEIKIWNIWIVSFRPHYTKAHFRSSTI